MFESLKNFLKESLFPLFCFGCKSEGTLLCHNCIKKISTNGVCVCPVCHIFTFEGIPCFDCQSSTFLSSHQAISIYEEASFIGQLIHEWKYNFVEEVETIFAILFEKYIEENKNFFLSFKSIIPVPLHKKRYCERGFNQAEKLAQMVTHCTGVPVKNILLRKVQTKQQATLSKAEREQNVKNVFCLKQGKKVFGEKILLVDDVFTTGATMNECAKVLKQNGAVEVHAFTLARG